VPDVTPAGAGKGYIGSIVRSTTMTRAAIYSFFLAAFAMVAAAHAAMP
jgi:hypothetical protein